MTYYYLEPKLTALLYRSILYKSIHTIFMQRRFQINPISYVTAHDFWLVTIFLMFLGIFFHEALELWQDGHWSCNSSLPKQVISSSFWGSAWTKSWCPSAGEKPSLRRHEQCEEGCHQTVWDKGLLLQNCMLRTNSPHFSLWQSNIWWIGSTSLHAICFGN